MIFSEMSGYDWLSLLPGRAGQVFANVAARERGKGLDELARQRQQAELERIQAETARLKREGTEAEAENRPIWPSMAATPATPAAPEKEESPEAAGYKPNSGQRLIIPPFGPVTAITPGRAAVAAQPAIPQGPSYKEAAKIHALGGNVLGGLTPDQRARLYPTMPWLSPTPPKKTGDYDTEDAARAAGRSAVIAFGGDPKDYLVNTPGNKDEGYKYNIQVRGETPSERKARKDKEDQEKKAQEEYKATHPTSHEIDALDNLTRKSMGIDPKDPIKPERQAEYAWKSNRINELKKSGNANPIPQVRNEWQYNKYASTFGQDKGAKLRKKLREKEEAPTSTPAPVMPAPLQPATPKTQWMNNARALNPGITEAELENEWNKKQGVK